MNQETIPESQSPCAQTKDLDFEAMVELRPLPAVAMRISQACTDEKFDTKELTTLVECDPAFASKILSVVNSSMYGFSREVSSIKAALVVLGRKNISQLAVTIAAQKVFSAGEVANRAKKVLYRHSLGCAAVCRSIANEIAREVDSGEAFLAGMLHDVGKLVLLDLAPDSYSKILTSANSDPSSTIDVETQIFGTDHTSIGTMFGNNWQLSVPICNAITYHHEDECIDELSLVEVTRLANELSKEWGIGQTEQPTQCEHTIKWVESASNEHQETIRTNAANYFTELSALLGG